MQRGEPEKGGETNETVSGGADAGSHAVRVCRISGGAEIRLYRAGKAGRVQL